MIDLSNIRLDDKLNQNYSQFMSKDSQEINFFWLGLQDYAPTLSLQKKIHKSIIQKNTNDTVLMLEHKHVYTLGKNADENHILPLQNRCSNIEQIDRGGDVTYHGPGQLVCYPIINLENYHKSVSWYVGLIEQCIIDVLKKHKIDAVKKKSPLIGIWVDDEKIAAIGIRMSRWVSMHGFAINVNTDLSYFDGIIPCGIFDYGVTSMQEITSRQVSLYDLAKSISKLFLERIKKAVKE